MTDEVTGDMTLAAQKAEQAWHTSQSGPVHRAIYEAMRRAAGVSSEELEQEMLNYTDAMHAAAVQACAEWERGRRDANGNPVPNHPPRPVDEMYRAIRAAA